MPTPIGSRSGARVSSAGVAAALALAAASVAAEPIVVLSGGGGGSSGGGITASLSIGQPVIGVVSGTPVSARLGFWHVAGGCLADFNNSGGPPTVQDIFDFLAAYFLQDPRADFNGIGGITVQDIFDYLAAYFTPC